MYIYICKRMGLVIYICININVCIKGWGSQPDPGVLGALSGSNALPGRREGCRFCASCGPNRPFQVRVLHWRAPESGDW